MDLSFVGPEEARWAEVTIRRSLHRFRAVPDYEELCAEAWLEFWQDMARSPPEDWRIREACIRKACRRAAADFKSSSANSRRTENTAGKPLPLLVALGEWHGTEPDFAPRVVERLWREEVWEAALSLLSDEEREFALPWLRGEVAWGAKDAALRMRLHRLLNRYRAEVGAPLKAGGQLARGYGYPRQTPEEKRAARVRRAEKYRAQYWANPEESRRRARERMRRCQEKKATL